MKELLQKLAWKKCHIATVNHKFKDVTILDVADGFVLIETDEKEKVLINLQFIRIVVEAKEGALPLYLFHMIYKIKYINTKMLSKITVESVFICKLY